ncbi:MAG: hypothetical protein ABEJ28_00680 [Salinigranum sp.]
MPSDTFPTRAAPGESHDPRAHTGEDAAPGGRDARSDSLPGSDVVGVERENEALRAELRRMEVVLQDVIDRYEELLAEANAPNQSAAEGPSDADDAPVDRLFRWFGVRL